MADIDITSEIERYEAERAELIATEKRLRHDYEFRQRLSPTAKRAAEIVARIRKDEAENVWKKAGDEEGDVFPGMSFTLAKDRMEPTRLWRIVKRMPKGALLHAHLEAMVDMDWLLDAALDTAGMGIRSDIPLATPEALRTANVEFEFSPDIAAAAATAAASIFSPSYTPGTLLPVRHVAAAFPAAADPTAAFRAWFKTRTTITPEESMKQHEGINLIWAKFQSVFRVINGIIYYEPIYRRFLHTVFTHLHADGARWADIRMAFLMVLRAEHTGAPLPREAVVRIFGEVTADFQRTHPGFWGASVIWTMIRGFPAADIWASMQECVAVKKQHPDTISGFDLVGQEDLGRSYHSHLPELLRFRHLCRAEGVHIPLFLHAGETLGDGTETDQNLFDAFLLGARRIGHGFALYKHPHLMRLARDNGVCMEVCPISNEILRLTGSIMQHPLPALLAHGVPVSVNNDDPGILGQMQTSSLSHDYWQVLQAFENVGLAGLGDVAETGVRYAAFAGVDVGVVEGIREKRIAEWREEWEEFCAWIVREYGQDE